MLKEIEIDGRKFQYAVQCEANECDSYEYTEFYDGMEITKRKKWILWGEEIEIAKPKVAFTIYKDIHNPKLTKEWWRREIRKEVSLLKRSEEIENGQLI
jgi:hypothetical protein